MTENGAILVLNAGSSSLKYAVYRSGAEDLARELQGRIEALHSAPRWIESDSTGRQTLNRGAPEVTGTDAAAALLLDHLLGNRQLLLHAVGHRIVHGGVRYGAPVRLDDVVLADIEALVPLAPLHQPHNLAPVRLLRRRLPALPQVACFDTAFHRTQPEVEQRYALPERITALGVRRYGFHGLSYESIARRLPAPDPRAAAGRTIVLHLGSGASLCALQAGRSVATTMGFTALDGLPMSTRCGQLDPGVVPYLVRSTGASPEEIEHLLYHESGLLGVSGISGDLRALEASPAAAAAFAIDLFVHRITREIGALAAVLGGLDALVFTAGIGENSVRVRDAVCRQAAWLGVVLDDAANGRHGPRISAAGSPVAVWVLPADEEGMIAAHVAEVLGE